MQSELSKDAVKASEAALKGPSCIEFPPICRLRKYLSSGETAK